jgi:hypothetical protein
MRLAAGRAPRGAGCVTGRFTADRLGACSLASWAQSKQGAARLRPRAPTRHHSEGTGAREQRLARAGAEQAAPRRALRTGAWQEAPASCRPLWFSTMLAAGTGRPRLADRRCARCASLSMPLLVTKQKGTPAACTCSVASCWSRTLKLTSFGGPWCWQTLTQELERHCTGKQAHALRR